MLVAIGGEPDDVAKEHTDIFEAARLDSLGALEFLRDVVWKDNVEKIIGTFFFLFDLAQVGDLAIAQELFLQAGADAGLEQHRLEWLGEIILGPELNAMRHPIDFRGGG